jgi:hypothetical protein
VTQAFEDLARRGDTPRIRRAPWLRRLLLLVFAVFVVLALANLFGEQPRTVAGAGPAARLKLAMPRTVRGGLFFQGRIEVRALRTIEHPRLVLDRGFFEQLQFNSNEPQPVSEASRDGKVVFSYDALDAGDRLVVWLQYEVNPTNVGTRPVGVELDDADAPLVAIHPDITVLP